MKRRYLYVLLFAVPAVLTATVAAVAAGGAAAGALWLFVFGDDPWPASAGPIVLGIAGVAGALTLGAAGLAAYSVGKAQEQKARMPGWHVAAALGATLLLGLAIGLRVAGVQLGPVPDSVRCADLCRDAGLSGSSMPPRDSGRRTCSCLDSSGTAVKVVELTD